MRALVVSVVLGGCVAEPGTQRLSFGDDGKADGARLTLPSCASPQLANIAKATSSVFERGTVPARYGASGANTADVDVYIGSYAMTGAMADLIESAEHEVALLTYSWKDGSGREAVMLEALRRLQARRARVGADVPVTVRLLVDTMTTAPGGSGLTTTVMPALGARIEALALDPRYVRVELATYLHTGIGSLHSKSLIVDGRTAIVSSGNINWDEQRDGAFRFHGEVAVGLLADFDDAWRDGWVWTCGSEKYRPLEECAVRPQPLTHEVANPSFDGCQAVLIATRDATSNPFSNDIDNPQDQMFIAAFAGASQRIRIETPNLNDDAAKEAIIAAVQRGVTVEIVLSKEYEEFTESLPGQGGGNSPNVAELYERVGAEACSRLKIRWWSVDGRTPVIGATIGANHFKYASVDGALVIVGSANMDTQSWNKSRELNVLVDDPSLTAAWDAQLFEPDFLQSIVVDECR